jgi:tRNA (mo5U34)-methyltransferase
MMPAQDELFTAEQRMRSRLSALKAQLPDCGFPWYPYDSLANVTQIRRLSGADAARLLDHARKEGVLDVGCADGDLSFLFESLGCEVVAIDNAVTNHNAMRGVAALREALRSRIEIHDLDLDNYAALPPRRFGLGLLLGTLYHLRNPFHALDALARICDYCILSTRIARMLPGGKPVPSQAPIAYLLDADELNGDDSNYWIFFEPALQRMFKRTWWEVCASLTAGDAQRSDPVSDRDERAFYLLRSGYGLAQLRLISGWHEVENKGSRWTEREFSAGIPAEMSARRRMRLNLYLPEVALQRLGPIKLSATIDGQELRPAEFATPGAHAFERTLPKAPVPQERILRFALDKALAPGVLDSRELGLIVASLELE